MEIRDNKYGYLIKNPNYKLKANTALQIKFYIRYNPNQPPPKVVSLRLNAVTKCPEENTVTPEASPVGQLFTSEVETDALSAGQAAVIPSVVAQNSNPRPGASAEKDDHYPNDFEAFLLHTQTGQQKPLTKPSNILDSAVCGTVVKNPKPLITYGQVAQEGQFPWHAALYHSQGIDLSYVCGASLISLNHLLTVAHCVTKKKSQSVINPDNLVVYLGKFYLRVWRTPGLQDKRVEKIFVHPKYVPHNFSNDVAVLKLTEPAHLTNFVRPICLWEGPSQLELIVKKVGTVVGWGFDETGKVTEQLTKAHMPVVSQETCIYSFPDFYSRFTNSNTFCAGFINGTSVCNGDSGGGLVFPKPGSDRSNPVWQIRGLVSLSVATRDHFKCDSTHYAVFTDVAKYLDFINNAMRQ